MPANRPALSFERNQFLACLSLIAALLFAVPLPAQSPAGPSKEYIRAGGKLIAIEIPGAAAPVSVSISPSSVSLGALGTQVFTATVTGAANQSVTWSTPTLGTLVTSGNSATYTAPSSIPAQQQVTITATSAADPQKSASATITLNPPATVTVSVSPTAIALGPQQSQQFTAAVNGTSNQSVTWTKPSGLGSISSSTGLYTAPSTITVTSTATVRATSNADNGKYAEATVTLLPPGTAPPIIYRQHSSE